MSKPRDVLIVIDAQKLPPAWADVIDVSKPVPPGVKFFERKIVTSDFLWAIFGGCVCALLGVICLPLGAYMLWADSDGRYNNAGTSTDWWVIGFGFTTLIVAWICFASLITNWKLMRKQDYGQPTRLGIFLGANELLEARGDSFTLIPREKFVGLIGSDVKYTMKDAQQKDQTKSTRLPSALVRDDPRALAAAIEAWAKSIPSEI